MKTLPLWQMLEKWPKWQREQDNFIELAHGCLTAAMKVTPADYWTWSSETALWAQCDKMATIKHGNKQSPDKTIFQ